MVWKVVKDAVRRMWGIALMTSSLVAVMWMTVGDGGTTTATAFAISMTFTFLQGPLVGFALFGQRELIYLPLSRQQLWRARLTVALLVPVGFMLAAKLLALVSASVLPTGSTLTLGTVLLSSVYDLAYAGAGLGLLAWSGLGRTRRQIFGERALRFVLLIGSRLIVGMGGGWPMLFRRSLATEWTQLSSSAWVLLVAGLAVAVAIFFRSPKLAHSSRWQEVVGGRTKVRATQGPDSPAAGIARLMWLEMAFRLGGIVVIAPAFWFVSGDLFGFLLGLYIISLSVSLSTPTTGARAVVRSLRALPISTYTLSAVLAAQPLLTCLFVWILLIISRMSLGPTLPTLTIGLLCWLAGITSALNGAGMALAGSRFVRLMGPLGAACLVFLYAVRRLPIAFPVDVLAPFAAVGGVIAGLWLTFRALRANNAVYRPPAVTSWFAVQGPAA
jgi:hypothetical protein